MYKDVSQVEILSYKACDFHGQLAEYVALKRKFFNVTTDLVYLARS
jgi:hypothetical protein